VFRIDESDPRYLLAYEEQHEHSVEPYRELMRLWITRFETDVSFGVILVDAEEEHHDEEGHEHERDGAFEEAFTRLLNDFRRDHKADVERCTVGFVRVLPTRWLQAQSPETLEEVRTNWDRMARYMWGVPGMMCASVEEGRAWLDGQIAAFVPPSQTETPQDRSSSAKQVGLFYGSSTGTTEAAAFDIQDRWSALGLQPISAVNIGTTKNLSALLDYDCLILGIPTWNIGQLQDDWDIAFPQLDALDFTGKRIALFGVGDQYGYPDNFQDAMGILGAKLLERGATLVGRWSAEGYEFSESKALIEGQFIGLALDEGQSRESNRRIAQWLKQIAAEFAFQPQVTL
jgi:flavodoxin I